MYLEHGLSGVRGEVESGYQSGWLCRPSGSNTFFIYITELWVWKISCRNFLNTKRKCILKEKITYDIMPVGKKKSYCIWARSKSPDRAVSQSGESSFLLWWQSTHQAICCPYGHCLTIWWCSGRLHQPQQRQKKKSQLAYEHLLPLSGIGWTTKALYHIFPL